MSNEHHIKFRRYGKIMIKNEYEYKMTTYDISNSVYNFKCILTKTGFDIEHVEKIPNFIQQMTVTEKGEIASLEIILISTQNRSNEN